MELDTGTLRQNLDPFEQHDDAVLHAALRAAGLFSLQEGSINKGRFSLDTRIAGGGSNLSVGERQIIALARAMIRGSKLLILDEGELVSKQINVLELTGSAATSTIGMPPTVYLHSLCIYHVK